MVKKWKLSFFSSKKETINGRTDGDKLTEYISFGFLTCRNTQCGSSITSFVEVIMLSHSCIGQGCTVCIQSFIGKLLRAHCQTGLLILNQTSFLYSHHHMRKHTHPKAKPEREMIIWTLTQLYGANCTFKSVLFVSKYIQSFSWGLCVCVWLLTVQ